MPTVMQPSEKPAGPNPKSAKEFASLWATPATKAELVQGNANFPDMYRRQRRFVGQVINACIILHVFERLKDGASPEALGFFFIGKRSQHETAVLENGSDEEKLDLLIKMSNKNAAKRLKTHHDIIPPDTFAFYVKEHEAWRVAHEAWLRRQVVSLSETGKIDTSDTIGEETRDPRIMALNQQISDTIQIVNPGAKTEASIDSKTTRKQVEVKDIRDVNRAAVRPRKPEYAKDFIRIMNTLNKPKVVAGPNAPTELPRLFDELPEILPRGYYDQKLFVAIDRSRSDKGFTRANEATIAEVKIVPSNMERADELTAFIKPISEQALRYASDAPHKSRKEMEPRLVTLKEIYAIKKHEFQTRLEKLKAKDGKFRPDYSWPPMPNDTKVASFREFTAKLDELSTRINVEGIMSENAEWQREYLFTNEFQKLCANEDFRKAAEVKFSRAITSSSTLDPKWVKHIATASNFDVDAIDQAIRDQIGYTEGKGYGNGRKAPRLTVKAIGSGINRDDRGGGRG